MSDGGEQVLAVRWNAGALGCLLPLIAPAVLLFGFGALNPSMARDLAENRRGGWIRDTAEMSVGPVHVPLALLALGMIWCFLLYGSRWADEIALRATPEGLVPHWSTFMRRWAWDEIQDVRFTDVGRAPSILVSLRNGRRRAIRGVDDEGGAARAFAAAARERAGRARTETSRTRND